jgi:signal peptidase II
MGARACRVQGRRVRETLSEPTAPADSVRSHPVLLGGVAVSVVVADQLSKWWAINALENGNVIELFWTLRFRLAFNTGASFSMFGDYGRWIGVLAVAVVIGLIWQGTSAQDKWGATCLGLMLGGAVGNLVDRVFRGDDGLFSGAVVDFVDPQWWPIFNVADASLVIGVIGLVIWSFRAADA